jgi:PIN domain nuclease of toxin-antitoxin system
MRDLRIQSILSIAPDHTWEFRTVVKMHGDPFDRMLIAQARTENLTLVTPDRVLRQHYGEDTIW